MKNSKILRLRFLLLLGLAIAWFLVWLSRHHLGHEEKKNQIVETETADKEADRAEINSKVKPSNLGRIQRQQLQPNIIEPISPDQATPADQPMLQNNVPIAFWGKVIDQDGRPVPDVRIVMRARKWRLATATRVDAAFPEHETRTGDDGKFEWTGEEGDALDLETIEKEGYRVSPTLQKGYSYGRTPVPFNPDPLSPVVIPMWKLGESQKLAIQDKDTRIPYDGTPVIFDLLTGQKFMDPSATGDLRVTLKRSPLDIPLGYHKTFEWHAVVEAIDGGLIQSNDEFMYAAPEEGYRPRIEIDMPAGAVNWANIYNISFFAKTRAGKVFSRIKLKFRVDSPKPQTGFTIASAANPTGSRNLQP